MGSVLLQLEYNLGNRENSPQSRFVFDLTTALLSRQVQFKKTLGGKWERKVYNECLNQYIQFAYTWPQKQIRKTSDSVDRPTITSVFAKRAFFRIGALFRSIFAECFMDLTNFMMGKVKLKPDSHLIRKKIKSRL